MSRDSLPSLTVAVTSRALFDLEAEHAVFEGDGASAYLSLQVEREEQPPAPGPAFGLVQALSALNAGCDPLAPRVNLVVVSRNTPSSGLRFLNAVRSLGIGATKAIMTGGRPVAPKLADIGVDLFLTRSPEDGLAAAKAGVPAAVLAAGSPHVPFEGELRIAFDGDAVLFDDLAERAFEAGGYAGWVRHEAENAREDIGAGPISRFAVKLSAFRELGRSLGVDLRVALVTARDGDARHRAITTLRNRNVELDEAYFLGGIRKSDALRDFRPHLFLDDRGGNVEMVATLAPSGLVPRPEEAVEETYPSP